MKKAWRIFIEAIPVIIMIALIPVVADDYLLSGIYLLIIVGALLYRQERLDLTALILGIIILTIGEAFFIATGVETFTRTSLFGIMPLWLPLLWGCAFIAIKRAVRILR